eukprot:g5965.t1
MKLHVICHAGEKLQKSSVAGLKFLCEDYYDKGWITPDLEGSATTRLQKNGAAPREDQAFGRDGVENLPWFSTSVFTKKTTSRSTKSDRLNGNESPSMFASMDDFFRCVRPERCVLLYPEDKDEEDGEVCSDNSEDDTSGDTIDIKHKLRRSQSQQLQPEHQTRVALLLDCTWFQTKEILDALPKGLQRLGLGGDRSFVLGELKGRGASADVYTAYDRLQRKFAMKIVVAKSRRQYESYLEEAFLLKKFAEAKSKHVVRMYNHLELADRLRLYLVLEYAECDLDQYIKRFEVLGTTTSASSSNISGEIEMLKGRKCLERGMPLLPQVYDCWTQMLAAVAEIHRHKIIHCDIKPANFLLIANRGGGARRASSSSQERCSSQEHQRRRGRLHEPNYTIKLSDFGLATSLGWEETHVSRDGQCGTLRYMAPECIFQPANLVGRSSRTSGTTTSSTDEDLMFRDHSSSPDPAEALHRLVDKHEDDIDNRRMRRNTARPNKAATSSTSFHVRPSADVWSLGIILYSLLYLQTPFQGLEGRLRGGGAGARGLMFAISDPRVQIRYPSLNWMKAKQKRGSLDAPDGAAAFRLMVAVAQKCLIRDPEKRWPAEQLQEAWETLGKVVLETRTTSSSSSLTTSVDGIVGARAAAKAEPESTILAASMMTSAPLLPDPEPSGSRFIRYRELEDQLQSTHGPYSATSLGSDVGAQIAQKLAMNLRVAGRGHVVRGLGGGGGQEFNSSGAHDDHDCDEQLAAIEEVRSVLEEDEEMLGRNENDPEAIHRDGGQDDEDEVEEAATEALALLLVSAGARPERPRLSRSDPEEVLVHDPARPQEYLVQQDPARLVVAEMGMRPVSKLLVKAVLLSLEACPRSMTLTRKCNPRTQ